MIQFANPSVLWWLWLTLIPVIIHLLNLQKYKTVYFSNTLLLSQLKQESKRVNFVKNWLLLLLRMLMIATLVVLFAQPERPAATKVNTEDRLILLDNSLSTSLNSGDLSLLDEMKSDLTQLLQETDQKRSYFEYTSSNSNNWNKKRVSEIIDEVVQLTPAAGQEHISTLIKRYQGRSKAVSEIHVYSDFQKDEVDLQILSQDSLNQYYLHVYEPEFKRNISLDSLVVLSQDESGVVKFEVLISNHDNVSSEGVSLNLKVNGVNKHIQEIASLEPGENKVILELGMDLSLTNYCEMEVESNDLEYDNQLYFTIQPTKERRILALVNNSLKTYLTAIDSLFEEFRIDFLNPNNIQLDRLKEYDVVIHQSNNEFDDDQFLALLSPETRVILIPGKGHSAGYFGRLNLGSDDLISGSLKEPYKGNPFFKDVFEDSDEKGKVQLPYFEEVLSIHQSSWEVILELDKGQPLLVQDLEEEGKFLFLSNLDSSTTNFMQTALAVPVFYKLFVGNQGMHNLYINRSNSTVMLPRRVFNETFSLQAIDSSKQWVLPVLSRNGQQYLDMSKLNLPAGFYRLLMSDESVYSLAVNQSRVESKLIYNTTEDLLLSFDQKENIHVVSNWNEEKQSLNVKKSSLSPYFLMFLFALIGIEVLYLRSL